MHTLGIVGIFFCIYLMFRLISLTYSMRIWLDGIGSEFARLRDFFVLLLCGLGFASALAPAIVSDLYDVPIYHSVRALEKAGRPDLAGKLSAIFAVLWLVFILVYDFLVMRRRRIGPAKVKSPAKLKSKGLSKEDAERKLHDVRRGIRKNWLAAIVVFGVLSVGEGFFQDLLYVPYVKPFFCDKLSLLCE